MTCIYVLFIAELTNIPCHDAICCLIIFNTNRHFIILFWLGKDYFVAVLNGDSS